MAEDIKKDEELKEEVLDQVAGGVVAIDPNGSCDTEDKYLIMDDKSGDVLAKTGGYRKARKIAEQLGQSPELK